jgi:hypothetical protein
MVSPTMTTSTQEEIRLAEAKNKEAHWRFSPFQRTFRMSLGIHSEVVPMEKTLHPIVQA